MGIAPRRGPSGRQSSAEKVLGGDVQASSLSPPLSGSDPVLPSGPSIGFTQVAFAGHNRPADLGDPDRAEAQLRRAFDLLRRAGVSHARLLTGFAPGADVLAARAWSKTGLGPVHVVFPFTEEHGPPAARDLITSATWLDGARARLTGRNPHLDQTRWLIGAADLLVVIWTGRPARGAGGTADAVRLALEHGIPVLWLRPEDAAPLQLIRPGHLDDDFGFLEFLEELKSARAPLVVEATPTSLQAALLDMGLAGEDEGVDEPPSNLARDRKLALPWRTYAAFRRVLGGTGSGYTPPTAPPDLANQRGFLTISGAYEAADAEARRLGAVHRSHQVILLAVAILAAAAGSSSALWPDLKLLMVGLELMLALSALVIWLDSERGQRHHRWGDARRLAEDLRMERAAWVIGISTGPARGAPDNPAHRVRRRAGLPDGPFDPARVTSWGRWVVDEAVIGQAVYHRDQSIINRRISHRVHEFENASFALLLFVLVGYVLSAVIARLYSVELPYWMGGVVIMTGAIVPAIGAAGLALEATLSLGEQARRSQLLHTELDDLAATLDPGAGLERYRAVVKWAFRLERAQEERWSDEAARRRLFRGG